jgi:uncharacterized protein DUF6152
MWFHGIIDLPGDPLHRMLFFMKTSLAIITAIALVAAPAYAHHSFARAYYENQSISISGEIVAFEWRSPHAWVQVMAPDQNGQLQKYSAEWFNPSRLSKMNITRDTIKPGDHVVITGSPGRNANERTLHLKKIQRPSDGWKCC